MIRQKFKYIPKIGNNMNFTYSTVLNQNRDSICAKLTEIRKKVAHATRNEVRSIWARHQVRENNIRHNLKRRFIIARKTRF